MSGSFVVFDVIPFCVLYSSWKTDLCSHFTSVSGQSIYKYRMLPSYDLFVITEHSLKSGSVCTYSSWSIFLLLTIHSLAVIISCDTAKRQLFKDTNYQFLNIAHSECQIKISIERSSETVYMM